MNIEIKTTSVEPIRHTFSHTRRRFGQHRIMGLQRHQRIARPLRRLGAGIPLHRRHGPAGRQAGFALARDAAGKNGGGHGKADGGDMTGHGSNKAATRPQRDPWVLPARWQSCPP